MKTYPAKFIEWLVHNYHDRDGEMVNRWLIETETHVLDYLTTKQAFKHWKKINKPDIIEDGFGSAWSIKCPECGRKSMQVVRPGKVQCKHCG